MSSSQKHLGSEVHLSILALPLRFSSLPLGVIVVTAEGVIPHGFLVQLWSAILGDGPRCAILYLS